MGRELRRKEEKKNKNKISNKQKDLDTSIKGSTMIKLAIIILLVLVALYYVVAIFITKEIEVSWINDDTTETTDTVSNKILAKNVFNQSPDKYYVYFYDFNDEDLSISTAVDNSELTVYRVDTGSALNQNYVSSDSGNRNVTSIDNLKVLAPTFIEISADKVTAYYEGSNEILAFLD